MGNVALFIPRGSNNMDKYELEQWREHRKWQLVFEPLKAIVAFAFLIILCIWVGD